MTEFVGICPGPDKDNPVIDNLGYPRITTVFDCNNLVDGNRCKALQGEDSSNPDQILPCRVLYELLPSLLPRDLVTTQRPQERREPEDVSTVRTIITKNGKALSVNRERAEIVVSPLLPEGHDPVDLTQTQSRMLLELMENQGKVLSREDLAKAMFPGETVIITPTGRSVDNMKRKISEKLGENIKEGKILIETVRGDRHTSGGYTIREYVPPKR